MRNAANSNRRRVLWRAGVIPGLIAAVLVWLPAYNAATDYSVNNPACAVFDYQPGERIPPLCEVTDWLSVVAWSLAAFVVVAIIGLAAHALWPGWNDAPP